MKRKSLSLLTVCLVLMALTAVVLFHQQAHQKLGSPGVRVVAVPMLDEKGNMVATNSIYLPATVLNYKSETEPVTEVTLGWLPKDTTYGQRIYKAPDGFQAALHVVLMGTDRTSIHKPKYCLEGLGWALDPEVHTTIPISQPFPYALPVMKLNTTHEWPKKEGGKTVQRGVYVYWFVADGEVTALHGQRMWWMARDMLRTGVLQRWAYIACFSACAPGQEDATFNRMKELIAAAVPQFQLATAPPGPLARNP